MRVAASVANGGLFGRLADHAVEDSVVVLLLIGIIGTAFYVRSDGYGTGGHERGPLCW